MHVSGPDRAGRPVLVLVGARLPAWGGVDKRRFARYVYRALASLASAPAFSVLYYHTDVTDANRPGASWLWNAFEVLPATLQERLGALYVIHPAATLRGTLAMLPFLLFSPFSSGAIAHKTVYLDRLEHLWPHIDEKALRVPQFVAEHDKDLAEQRACLLCHACLPFAC